MHQLEIGAGEGSHRLTDKTRSGPYPHIEYVPSSPVQPQLCVQANLRIQRRGDHDEVHERMDVGGGAFLVHYGTDRTTRCMSTSTLTSGESRYSAAMTPMLESILPRLSIPRYKERFSSTDRSVRYR